MKLARTHGCARASIVAFRLSQWGPCVNELRKSNLFFSVHNFVITG